MKSVGFQKRIRWWYSITLAEEKFECKKQKDNEALKIIFMIYEDPDLRL